jgi:hypothetical protein
MIGLSDMENTPKNFNSDNIGPICEAAIRPTLTK